MEKQRNSMKQYKCKYDKEEMDISEDFRMKNPSGGIRKEKKKKMERMEDRI